MTCDIENREIGPALHHLSSEHSSCAVLRCFYEYIPLTSLDFTGKSHRLCKAKEGSLWIAVPRKLNLADFSTRELTMLNKYTSWVLLSCQQGHFVVTCWLMPWFWGQYSAGSAPLKRSRAENWIAVLSSRFVPCAPVSRSEIARKSANTGLTHDLWPLLNLCP